MDTDTSPERLSGVFAPVITPFDAELRPDARRLAVHARWLLSQGVRLAVFGTNSEANSLSVDEKIDLLDRLVDAGVDAANLLPGTGCCALSDTVRLTRHAVQMGCSGVLMLPPFYYKAVSDEGLFRSYAEVIERVGDARLRVYLYHIPPVAQVGLSVSLIERLITAYPDTVVGIKDSSGDWSNTASMLEREWDDFRVFVGSETFLLQNMRGGGAGCISATANVNPAAIVELYEQWEGHGGELMQRKLDAARALISEYPMIPALKSTVASFHDDAAWRTVRPPLVPLSDAEAAALRDKLDAFGLTVPGLVDVRMAVEQ